MMFLSQLRIFINALTLFILMVLITDASGKSDQPSSDELSLALSELSVSDLNSLSQLIDVSYLSAYDDEKEDNDQENSIMYESDSNQNTDNDAEYVLSAFNNKLRRVKRANVNRGQNLADNEEYLKQLENSFPRDQEQSDFNYDGKKDHIRIKRTHLIDNR